MRYKETEADNIATSTAMDRVMPHDNRYNHFIRYPEMHEAERFLRNPETLDSLYVRYKGRRRRLFFKRDQNLIGIITLGKRNRGHEFNDWQGIERIILAAEAEDPEEFNRRLIRKFQREAAKAGFTNPFIRKVRNADYGKGLYENGITSGTPIDGQIITLDAVRKWCGETTYRCFCEAVRNRTPYRSARFNFRGYDGSLWVEIFDKNDGYYRAGDLNAGFSKEFRGCANGYYYLLINERTFIGFDID